MCIRDRDEPESPENALKRELMEETGLNKNYKIISKTGSWLEYKLPQELVDEVWNGKYIGQKQIWFACRFFGNDDQVDIKTRTIAVEVLAKKQAPELVDYFIQLLGEPSNRHRLNEFTLSVMGDIDNERMILALLESYKNGKSQYHSLLNSVLATVEEYQNPEIIPLLKEVALSDALPNGTRLKAIKALAKFKDERSMDAIIEMLEDPRNYVFYYDILMVIDDFGGYNEFKNSCLLYTSDAADE